MVTSCGNLQPYAQPYDNFSVYNAWVYIPGGSPKTNKDRVYTPMVGSQIIYVMVYAHFGVSPILKIKPLTLDIHWLVKITTQAF